MAPLSAQGSCDAYLDLVKRSVTNFAYLGGESSFENFRCAEHYDLQRGGWKIDPLCRPLSLLSKLQLDLIDKAAVWLEERRVPGDFLEAGIWRGGAVILMRALIEGYGMTDRKVFAADSFAGIPKNVHAQNDAVDSWSDRWVAPLDQVKQSIERFGLLDDKIVFVVGFFADSLKQLSGERFALIRLDSDSYDSVETSLDYLYPLLSKSGIVIIDDWHLAGCKQAVLEYRSQHGIHDPIQVSDNNAYWVKRQEYGSPNQP